MIVRDTQGQFVADLAKDDFEVYEDGVKQDVVTFVLTHGGRVINDVSAPPPPVQEGILLPPPRPTNDASGRIFLIFVDDLHMDFRNTGRIRDLFKKISKELVHDGDMFGIVSTGPSSIAQDMTYDRKRLDEAISKISGAGLKPDGDHRDARRLAGAARSALPRARRVLDRLRHPPEDGADPQPPQGVHLREQRLRLRSVLEVARQGGQQRYSTMTGSNSDGSSGDVEQLVRHQSLLEVGQRIRGGGSRRRLSELTREANRANVTMYTIDPRGLVGGPDLDETKLDMMDWQDHIRETQSSLRVSPSSPAATRW